MLMHACIQVNCGYSPPFKANQHQQWLLNAVDYLLFGFPLKSSEFFSLKLLLNVAQLMYIIL